MSGPIPDRWAEWVLTTRYGTDEAHRRRVLDYLRPIRDRILKNASISAGDTLIDVGTGDGLIAFGAVPLVGAEGKVILSDVSPTLIDHVAKSAAELQVYDRCDYLVASADDPERAWRRLRRRCNDPVRADLPPRGEEAGRAS